ncbi:hypothetical protein HYN43_010455 [Mucilaginibacter celer]|uniref:Uncharacterized protein n=1 Tax=Mucilaginibacter celer TaxID=2305508 RepID=A0A494VW40_9SPHI|nr:hypothetical protein HYN43_010455 [Mucilaginibacter celer]
MWPAPLFVGIGNRFIICPLAGLHKQTGINRRIYRSWKSISVKIGLPIPLILANPPIYPIQ